MQRFLTLKYAGFAVLLGLNAYVWSLFLYVPAPHLTVAVLDIGQGDSIYVEGPTGIQMLVDGGPDHSVLRQLPKEMRFFDRSLDLMVETHPDKDHIAGLTDVLGRYQVSYFMSPGIPGSTATAQGLEHAVSQEPGMRSLTARRGMRIHMGGGAYADVLYPDHDVSKGETNEGSIVMHVVYGKTSFMLTGDAPSDVEAHLIALDSAQLPSTVLKAGHHGSKYSTSDAWLVAVKPQTVAISVGANNSYGHPNQETIGRIKDEGAQILSTIDQGTLHFVSDGAQVVRK
jgi:competence protein ComEC